MDDEFGADDALLEAMAATDPTQPSRPSASASRPAQQQQQQQPTPQKVQQPTPQRLDKAPPKTTSASGNKVVQPTPQALPQRTGGSTLLVSPRQRGNPVLTAIKSVAWEYSDIPADYVMGNNTCALFLSLKYHRLHPEYVYTRIRNLQGRYTLRILLTMVDIPNHEDPLRELSKTSLVNGVTLILCWSAAEAARYLELYKTYDGPGRNGGFAAIKGQQSTGYADRLVDFVTVPRSLNKSDAVALVANFGSLRNAVNAESEQLGMISGWGGTKVKRWSKVLDEPFRVKKVGRRTVQRGESSADGQTQGQGSGERSDVLDRAMPISRGVPAPKEGVHTGTGPGAVSGTGSAAGQFQLMGDIDDDDEDEEAMLAAAIEESKRTSQPSQAQQQQEKQTGDGQSQSKDGDELSGGIAAALARLRDNGG